MENIKTVKVRIAVAVTQSGEWNSAGWSSGDDQDKMNLAVDSVDSGEARYWLEAELPIPSVAVVQAEVSQDK